MADINSFEPIGAHVLIIDDRPQDREMACAMLDKMGCTTESADGLYAIEYLEKEKYDIILVDINMPGIDGHEIAEAVRRSEWPNKNTPIVAFSATIFIQEDVKKCKASGMNDVLSRPFKMKDLELVIRRNIA